MIVYDGCYLARECPNKDSLTTYKTRGNWVATGDIALP